MKEPEKEVYSFGQNAYGELGVGDIIERNAPTKLEIPKELRIVQVAAGNELSIFLSEEGEVYMCGFFESGSPLSGSYTERSNQIVGNIKKVEGLEGQKISRIFASNGCEHAVALTRLGKLWVFGNNIRGQLGIGDNKSIPIPVKQEALWRKVVRTVGTSYYHTIFACEELETYGCGRNDNGQLGIGVTSDILLPALIEDLNGHMVGSIGCGQYHTVIATASAQVYAFGKNDNGQLGITPFQSVQKKPARIAGLEANKVACGYYHTLAISTTNKVFAWGKNDSGQLGIGDRVKAITPQLVERLAEVETLQIACGCYHSLVLTKSGLYAFGRNNHGQLGINPIRVKIIPFLSKILKYYKFHVAFIIPWPLCKRAK